MKSQYIICIESLTAATGRTSFTTKEIAIEARRLYKNGTLINNTADYPYFQSNYVASALRNMVLKPKNPKLQRHLQPNGNYTYSLKS